MLADGTCMVRQPGSPARHNPGGYILILILLLW